MYLCPQHFSHHFAQYLFQQKHTFSFEAGTMAGPQQTDPAQFPALLDIDPCFGRVIDESLTSLLGCTDWKCACQSYGSGTVFSSVLSSECESAVMYFTVASSGFGQFCAQTDGPNVPLSTGMTQNAQNAPKVPSSPTATNTDFSSTPAVTGTPITPTATGPPPRINPFWKS